MFKQQRVEQAGSETNVAPGASQDTTTQSSVAQSTTGPGGWPPPRERAFSTVSESDLPSSRIGNGADFTSRFGNAVTPGRLTPGAGATVSKTTPLFGQASPEPQQQALEPVQQRDLFGTAQITQPEIPESSIPTSSAKPPQGMIGLYAHEQLLDNPGGDAYVVEEGVTEYIPGNDDGSFTARVKKGC